MSAQHTPGPWTVSRGNAGMPEGFYVSRTSNGKTEWMRAADGRIAGFRTEYRAAIAKATGSAA